MAKQRKKRVERPENQRPRHSRFLTEKNSSQKNLLSKTPLSDTPLSKMDTLSPNWTQITQKVDTDGVRFAQLDSQIQWYILAGTDWLV